MNDYNELASKLFASVRRARSGVSKTILALAVVVGVMSVDAQSQAQTARFRSPVHRVSVPLGYSGTFAFTNTCSVSGLVNPVDLTITGLPAGVTYSIAATNGALTLDGGFPSTLITTNLLITLNFDGSELQGLSTASLVASGGAVNNWDFNVQVAKIWSGADYLSGVSTNWNDAGNWVGASVPGASDDVIFAQSGATNAATITNVFVTANTIVSSIRFAPTNSAFKTYTLSLNPGVTLAATGSQGFSLLKDVLNVYTGLGGMTVTLQGIGGTLAVNNETANFYSYVDNQQAYTFDCSGLGNLACDVNRFGLADYTLFPNYRNYNDQNNYGGQPRSAIPTINFARTNSVKAVFADPYNYTNSDSRRYGFSLVQASELSGSGTQPVISFGISNIFNVDGVCIAGANSRCTVQFNTIFAASNPIAIFRGTNGGRMSMYCESDGGATNTANSNIKCTVDLSKGSLDMLVDRFYIGRDRTKIQSGSTPNYAGGFLMGKGTLDANTMILGFREHAGEATNANYAYGGYCEGQFTVNSNGIARVNKSLTLGYTTESNPNGLGSGGNTEYGQVTLLNGGNLLANTINVGGPAYGSSRNNFIIVSNNASLVVSNTVAGTNQALDFIAFANGSTLTLTLNATSTVAAVYATNFNMTASNSFVLAAIKNPLSLTNGSQIPLFKRMAGASPNFTKFNLSGINGQVVVDSVDPLQDDFQIILNTPKNLLWQGYASANWDNATKNWLDLTTGLHTNFAAGDNVSFDDSALQFNLSLDAGAVVLPGSIAMSNTANSYVLNNSGGGSIIGSSILTKTGSNSLEIDGATSVSIVLNAGSLTGSGSVASVTVGAGAAMTYSGTISGNLTSAGRATSSGTVSGALVVQSGGVVTNSGAMNGTFTVAGGLLVNNLGAGFASIGTSSSVGVGGTLVNRGAITGVNIAVNGTFKDTGEGIITLTGTFTAASGATIIPGGDGVATTTIQAGTASGFPGRVLLSQGSTNIFKVDIIGSANTKLLSGFQDFGGSAAARTQSGCTLVITNISGTFAAGQSFTLFQYAGGGNPLPTGTSTNTYPVISPTIPGAGLAWDLTQLWPSGTIGVVSAASGPIFTNSFVGDGSGTNIVGQFSWDASYQGWRLQNLVTPITVGLAADTNYTWTSIAGSWTNTAVTITNTIGTNCVFYRLVFP